MLFFQTLVLVLNLVVSAVQDGKLRVQMFVAIESILCHSIRLPENENQTNHHHEAKCHCGKWETFSSWKLCIGLAQTCPSIGKRIIVQNWDRNCSHTCRGAWLKAHQQKDPGHLLDQLGHLFLTSMALALIFIFWHTNNAKIWTWSNIQLMKKKLSSLHTQSLCPYVAHVPSCRDLG